MSLNQQDLASFRGCFNKTVIPFTLVGYQMIKANSARVRSAVVGQMLKPFKRAFRDSKATSSGTLS